MIENYYQGDKSWNDFVEVFPDKSELEKFKVYTKLNSELKNHSDLSRVIFESIGQESCLVWINHPVPALDGLSPKECLEGNLLIRLRTMLMRM